MKQKQTVERIIQRYNQLELEITAVEEVIALVEQEFGSRDGIQPKNIVVTDSGRRVPADNFSIILSQLRTLLLNPLKDERASLKDMKVK